MSNLCSAAKIGLTNFIGWMYQAQLDGTKSFINRGLGYIAIKTADASNDSGVRIEHFLAGFLASAGCTLAQTQDALKLFSTKSFGFRLIDDSGNCEFVSGLLWDYEHP